MSGIVERGSITKRSQNPQTTIESDSGITPLRLVTSNRNDGTKAAECFARCNHDVPTHQRIAFPQLIRPP